MLNFENIEDLVAHMFDKLDGDEPVSVVADKKFSVAIMQELLNYENVDLNYANVDAYDYDKEYLVSLYDDTDTDYWHVSINQIYNYEKDKYFGADGYVLFHEDVNSKALVDMLNNEFMPLGDHDWFVIEEDEKDNDTDETETVEKSDNGEYSISVKYNLDTREAEKIIQDMERRIEHMNDMFREMDNFRRLFNW